MSSIVISELPEVTEVDDSSYIPVDSGRVTRKISVGNYNATANNTAKAYMQQAQAAAASAGESATQAAQTISDMDAYVSTVTGIANTVTGIADTVSANATLANNAATLAATSASNASTYAADAADSVALIGDASLLAESWAKGGTGIRDGEDTNNAQYFARQASAAISGGVTSFNGRGGAVNAETGDYVSSMIPRSTASGSQTVEQALAALEGRATTIEGNVSTLQGNLSSLESVVNGHTTAIGNVESTANSAVSAAAAAQTTADNANAAVATTNTRITNAHKQYLHSFTNGNWELVSGGDWDGYYRSVKSGRTIHNPSGSVRASGASLSSPPSDSVKKAVASMYFEIDDVANTLTAYAKEAPAETVYVAVEGVQ